MVYREIIRVCVQTGGIPPSIREIGGALGIWSTNTVYRHLKILEAAGLITRAHGGSRGITVVGGKWSPPEAARQTAEVQS